MLKKLKFLLILAAVFAVAGCKAEVTEEEEVTAETPKYTITYDAAGHGTAPEAKNVEEGYKLTEEDLPALTADGFDFGGWKFNEKIVAAGEDVFSDMTLIAAWTEWGTVAAPTFSVVAGEVDKGTKVTITCTTEGAAIYYTIDGTEPTAGSTKYESEIDITAATTIKAFAVKSGMKNSTVAEVTYTVDVTPPAPVTNLTAKCTASQTVKLTWTNPTDADFVKVVITYGTDGKVEVLKTATPNNEATIEGFTDGTEYTFTVKAYDTAENESSGVNKKCTPFSGTAYNATNNGGLEGYTNQTQGAVLEGSLKETWMADSGNLKINETEIAKTSEVIVVPAGTVAVVTMTDDSSWNGYYNGSWAQGKGAFIANRKVKLDPFVMSQYEVTQKLYEEVMENNPSNFQSSAETGETQENRPVEKVTWYQACVFCNELTKKTFGDEAKEYVYYSDSNLSTPYTKDDADNKTTPYIAYDTTNKKWTKKGYRLPTEAEWEFAARGGDPNAAKWSYAYAGVQTGKPGQDFNLGMVGETTLREYGWYYDNSNSKTHEVGLREKNKLNIYDMSGNVFEWCYDWYYYEKVTIEDESYKTTDGYVQNPVVVSTSSSGNRCRRGGTYNSQSYYCSVSFCEHSKPDNVNSTNGIRVCRSIEITN